MARPLAPAIWLDSVDSTNEEAKRRAQAGQAGPLWIAAREQTAGRGRRGRAWDSLAGNLFCTLLLRPDWAADRSAQLAFAAALAMAEAAETWVEPNLVRLKWPNDLLLDGKKAGGCLLEAGQGHGSRGGESWLVIGVGLNLASAPADGLYPATRVSAHLRPGVAAPSPEAALEALSVTFVRWLDRWRAESFSPLRDAVLARVAGVGEPVTARLADGSQRTGVFEDIDAAGALVLRSPEGHRATISAADVFFNR